MKMNMKSLLGAVVISAATLIVSTTGAVAQNKPVTSIDELIARVGRDSREANAEAQRRVQEFTQKKNQQQRLLNKAKAELKALRAREAANNKKLDQNKDLVLKLDEDLRVAQGSFGELFGAARQAAGEIKAVVDVSFISGQYPGRGEGLGNVANSAKLPEVYELENIYKTILQEAKAQGEVVTYSGSIPDVNNGAPVEITRVGPFTSWTAKDARFLKVDEGDLGMLARQPSGRLRGLARNVSNGSPDKITKGPVDPTRGVLLGLVVRTPTLMERFHAGGNIGYAVTVMAAIGSFIGLWRLFALFTTSMAVRAQMRKPNKISKGNPLGRIMMAYESSKDRDIETIELKLDDAILKESGKLDYGLSLIKVLAAVSPLMGLLGTVIGMIKTFQAITLFGAGDPQLMADGISFALVTTVLGLLSAIPLLLLHSFTSSASRGLQQVLEEQAAGMIAANAEARSDAGKK
jgi:biopolymer transport protein ExbB